MADQKITQLTEETTPVASDLLEIVDDPSGTPANKKAQISNVVGKPDVTVTGSRTFSKVIFADAGELTISAGAITVTGSRHTVDTESDAASDDLDTINGSSDGMLLFLATEAAARDVVVKHNTGNILCDGGVDITLDHPRDLLIGIYDSVPSKWIVFLAANVSS